MREHLLMILPFLAAMADVLVTLRGRGREVGIVAAPLARRIGLERAVVVTMLLRWGMAAGALWLHDVWLLGLLTGESAAAAMGNWLRTR